MKLFATLSVIIALVFTACQEKQETARPNIVIIYADDLGYGDVSCYGATSVKTPNIDRLAENGIRFTDAHSTAATCTPSRFSILTGSYAFRNNAAILPGDAPLLIRPGTPTLPGMLQQAGYTTGVVGKWHLGLGNGVIDWNGEIGPGPLEIGFNYSFLMPATADRVPCVYVENHRVYNLNPSDPIVVNYDKKVGSEPTGLERPDLLKIKADTQHSNTIINGISRIGFTTGGRSAWWVDEQMPNVLLEKSNRFLEENKSKPFFLYLSLTDIHVPRAPNPKFKGATAMGSRGDVIVQMDWLTGEVVKSLERLGLTENTIVIFTSDNGPVLNDGYDDESEKLVGSHKPAGIFRGGKYSAYEGGTRVPTIISWPSRIKPGVNDALISQVDFFASIAQLTGRQLNAQEAPDSYNMLPELLGESKKGRSTMLEEAFTFALRDGDWKYVAPQKKSTPAWLANKDIETGLSTSAQLYNLRSDPSEQKNVIDAHPEQAEKMKKMLEQIEAKASREGYQNTSR